MQAPIAQRENDSLRAATAPPRPFDKPATARVAVKLIKDGCLSKAMCYLRTLGLGDHEIVPIKPQLRR